MIETFSQGSKPNPASLPVAADAAWEKVYAFAEDDYTMLKGLNFHPANPNELWFIDIGMGRVMKLDVSSGKLEKFAEAPGKHTPNDACFIDNDTLLITDRMRGMCTFTISTGEYKELQVEYELDEARWGLSANDEKQGFGILNSLVLDGTGKGAYVTDPDLSDYVTPTGRVWYIDYSNHKSGKVKASVWARGIKYANGITISPDANFLYISEFNTNSIINVPTAKYCKGMVLDTPYVVARLSGGHGPDGIITDEDGNIYAAHLHATEVCVIDKQGRTIQDVILPDVAGPDPSDMCIHDGYMYVCEFAKGVIWRIAIKAKPNPLL